jgi:hypothetical protein
MDRPKWLRKQEERKGSKWKKGDGARAKNCAGEEGQKKEAGSMAFTP